MCWRAWRRSTTSYTILGRKSALPLMLSPTAVQRAFHWQGERAVARAAGMACGSASPSLATHSIEEIAALTTGPKLFQLYVHKDKGLNAHMIERCQAAKFDALALTVDLLVSNGAGGLQAVSPHQRGERMGYARGQWTLDYVLREVPPAQPRYACDRGARARR